MKETGKEYCEENIGEVKEDVFRKCAQCYSQEYGHVFCAQVDE